MQLKLQSLPESQNCPSVYLLCLVAWTQLISHGQYRTLCTHVPLLKDNSTLHTRNSDEMLLSRSSSWPINHTFKTTNMSDFIPCWKYTSLEVHQSDHVFRHLLIPNLFLFSPQRPCLHNDRQHRRCSKPYNRTRDVQSRTSSIENGDVQICHSEEKNHKNGPPVHFRCRRPKSAG